MKKNYIYMIVTAALLSGVVITGGCGVNKENDMDEGIKEAIRQETTVTEEHYATTPTPEITPAATPSATPTPVPPAEISDKLIPVRYTNMRGNAGKIEHISYMTKDYYGDGHEMEKYAYVYLPKDYNEEKKYNILYLMHGIGGDELEWGMTGGASKVKAIMDNLDYYGDIESFIVVAANGRSGADFANRNADYNSFYKFGEELRNDLIPYIDEHYSTYAEYEKDGYDMTAARDHRAMAGLSMGGMQTINIGMCECLDLISWFGAFSAAPTSYEATKVAKLTAENDYKINYMYNICGTGDGVAYASHSNAAKLLPKLSDKLTDGENYRWHDVSGAHDFNVWYLGYYNFAQIVFKGL